MTETPTMDTIRTELAELREEVQVLRTAQFRFRDTVREAIKDMVDSGDIEKSTANELLDNIGLDKLVSKFQVTATVELSFTVELGEDTDADTFDPEETLGNSLTVDVNSYRLDDSWELDDLSVVNVDHEELDE